MRTFNTKVPKKPFNLSINSILLVKAIALNINLSATLEEALTKQFRVKHALWLKENAQAINSYNKFVEENGVSSDELRKF